MKENYFYLGHSTNNDFQNIMIEFPIVFLRVNEKWDGQCDNETDTMSRMKRFSTTTTTKYKENKSTKRSSDIS